MADITKTGPLRHDQLKKENDSIFVSKNYPYDYLEWISGKNGTDDNEDDLQQQSQHDVTNGAGNNYDREFTDEEILALGDTTNPNISNTVNVFGDTSRFTQGKGHSRYDKRYNNLTDLYDINENRAREQTGFNKLMSGVGKMGVIAATTALDNIIGTAAGLVNLAAKGVSGQINSLREAGDAFVSNPASKFFIDINNKAEEWMPNYYTREERELPWYQQIWTANFIGDHMMKNTGFFLGTALAMYATAGTGLLPKLFKVKEARNIFKNTAMAAGLGMKSPKEVLKAYKTGEKIASTQQVSKALADAAKNARRADMNLKLASSAIASFGESRMEAISNSDEWFGKNKKMLEYEKYKEIKNLEQSIRDEVPSLFETYVTTDENGNINGQRRVIADKNAYNAEYNRRRNAIEKRYEEMVGNLTKERIDYANSSFGINFLLTFGENMSLIADAAVGSWSKRLGANKAVRNIAKKNIKKGIANEVVEETIDKGAKRAVKQLGELRQKKGQRFLDIGKGFLKGPAFETEQEMSQESTTEHLNRIHGKKINDYYGSVLDPDGLKAASNSMYNFVNSLVDTHTDPNKWESGFLGLVTALLPLPTRSMTTNKQEVNVDENKKMSPKEKLSQYASKWQIGGEFWESIREANKKYKETNAAIKALNDIGDDDAKRDVFFDLMRQDRIRELQQDALDEGDQRKFKDYESDLIASQVMTYTDAGQFDYLMDMLDELYTVETPEQVSALRQFVTYKAKQGDIETVKSLYDEMTDQQIIDYYKDQKQKIQEKAQAYHDIYENINKTYGDFGGDGLSKAYVKSIAQEIMSIDDREHRIQQVSDELLDIVRNYSDQIRKSNPNKDMSEIEEAVQQLQDIHNLDIAFGDEGIVSKLDELQEKRLKKISDKIKQKDTEIKNREEYLDELDKEFDKLENNDRKKYEAVFRKEIKKRTKSIRDLLEKQKKYIGQRGTIDTIQKFNDLTSMLFERELLYNKLYMLSGDYGQDIFQGGMMMDIYNLGNKYADKALEKVYNKYRDEDNLDFEGFDIERVARYAEKNNDQKTADRLRFVDKINQVFAINEFPHNEDTDIVYGEIQDIVSQNKDKPIKDIEVIVDQYLEGESGNENQAVIKTSIKSVLDYIKEQERNARQADGTVQNEQENNTAGTAAIMEFYTETPDEFNKYLDGFDSTKQFLEDIKQKGIYDDIVAAIIEKERYYQEDENEEGESESKPIDVENLTIDDIKVDLQSAREDFIANNKQQENKQQENKEDKTNNGNRNVENDDDDSSEDNNGNNDGETDSDTEAATPTGNGPKPSNGGSGGGGAVNKGTNRRMQTPSTNVGQDQENGIVQETDDIIEFGDGVAIQESDEPYQPEKQTQPNNKKTEDGVDVQESYEPDQPKKQTQPNNKKTILGEIKGGLDMGRNDLKGLKDQQKQNVQHGNISTNENSFDEQIPVWHVLRYGGSWDVGKLKEHKKVQYVPAKETGNFGGKDFYKDAFGKIITESKSQEFVQTGLLQRVIDYYKENDDNRQLLRFVKITDKNMFPEYMQGDDVWRKIVLERLNKRVPLIAIEIDQNVINDIIEKERNPKARKILEKQFAESSFLTTMFGRDERGNKQKKTFQILGAVSPQTARHGELEKKSSDPNDNKYVSVDADFQNFMNEFWTDTTSKIKGIGKESVNGGQENGSFYRFSSFSVPLQWIYTGNYIKENGRKMSVDQDGNDVLVPLADILTEEQRQDPEGHFQIRVIHGEKHFDFGQSLVDDEEKIINLNTNFENTYNDYTGQSRNGSIWLLTRESDGYVYHKGLRMRRFDNDFYEKYGNDNPYINIIRNALSSIVKTPTKTNIKQNFSKIQRYLYINKGQHIRFDSKNDRVYIGSDQRNYVFMNSNDVEGTVDRILKLMMSANDSKGYRFSIGDSKRKDILKVILDSNILETDLAELHNSGASFSIGKLVKGENDVFETVETDMYKGRIHTGFAGEQVSKQTRRWDIKINGQEHVLEHRNNDGVISIDGIDVGKSGEGYYGRLFSTMAKIRDGQLSEMFSVNGTQWKVYSFINSNKDSSGTSIVYNNETHLFQLLTKEDTDMIKNYKSGAKMSNQDVRRFQAMLKRNFNTTYRSLAKNKVLKSESVEDTQKKSEAKYGSEYPKTGEVIIYKRVYVDDNGMPDWNHVGNEQQSKITKTTSSLSIDLEDGTRIYSSELDLFFGNGQIQPFVQYDENNNRFFNYVIQKISQVHLGTSQGTVTVSEGMLDTKFVYGSSFGGMREQKSRKSTVKKQEEPETDTDNVDFEQPSEESDNTDNEQEKPEKEKRDKKDNKGNGVSDGMEFMDRKQDNSGIQDFDENFISGYITQSEDRKRFFLKLGKDLIKNDNPLKDFVKDYINESGRLNLINLILDKHEGKEIKQEIYDMMKRDSNDFDKLKNLIELLAKCR